MLESDHAAELAQVRGDAQAAEDAQAASHSELVLQLKRSHERSSSEALDALKRTHRTEVTHRRERSVDILTRAEDANKAALESMRAENARRVSILEAEKKQLEAEVST